METEKWPKAADSPLYKNRMICAIAINILNLKPFDFLVSHDPSPRFHQQRRPTFF